MDNAVINLINEVQLILHRSRCIIFSYFW
jgi:hypothetical protein